MTTVSPPFPDPPSWNDATSSIRQGLPMKHDTTSWKEFLLSLCIAFDEPTTNRLKWVRWMRETGRGFLDDIPSEVDDGTTPPHRPPDETHPHP